MKIGIIGGNGFVGKAMMKLFPEATAFGRDAKQEDIDACDAVFICVPTNLKKNGTLDMSIVEGIVEKCNSPLIIIRSTLQPGFSEYLERKYNKPISVMPEYVGETVNHPLLDEQSRPFLVIGGRRSVREKVIELMMTVYNANISIYQVSNYGAEIIKLAENRAIAWKVMQAQELYDVCQAADVDYYTVRDLVYGADPRFNLWFTAIYPDKRGFESSKCLSKDVPAFVSWAKSVGAKADMTELLVKKSRKYA